MDSRLVAGSLALVAAASATAGALLESGLPVPASQWMFILLSLIFPALGWLLAARRPGAFYSWLLLGTAVCLGLAALGTGLVVRFEHGPGFIAVLPALFAVYFGVSWIFIPLLFPDGRLPSRRWRPVAWLAGVVIALHGVGVALMPLDLFGGADPRAVELPRGAAVAATVAGLGQAVAFVLALVVFGNLIVRWRRSEQAERGQYAWMVAGVAVNLIGFVLLTIFNFGGGPLAVGMLGLVAVLGSLPVAIGVAVVRHQLLDIRVGVRGSRLQVVFDVRPTVGEMLSSLGSALEDTPEPVEQLGRLAAAVRTGLDVRWAAVTLADGTRVVAGREEGAAALTLPVRGGLGEIECGPREHGRLTGEDRRLLEALAVPAGLAIQSAGLATRLVNAQEAERRRIERNIHDGVQQQLVALIAGLELARARGAGPQVLAQLREQARQTLADLRELAAGIHPSALSQGGLVEAVEGRCARLPVPVRVTAAEGLRARRFSDEVEGAMYFTVSEAVANALKHSGGARIEVRLSQSGGRLHASISDDGKGFDPSAVTRRGLTTLADRLDALGGGLDLDSTRGEGPRGEGPRGEGPRGEGTRLNAWVPADA